MDEPEKTVFESALKKWSDEQLAENYRYLSAQISAIYHELLHRGYNYNAGNKFIKTTTKEI